jgi:hypothetical protein
MKKIVEIEKHNLRVSSRQTMELVAAIIDHIWLDRNKQKF